MPAGCEERICVTRIYDLQRQVRAEVILKLMDRRKANETTIVGGDGNGARLDRRLCCANRDAALKVEKGNGRRQCIDGKPIRN
jgi:hypothetical protein